MYSINDIKKQLKKSEIKELNNIPSADKDFVKGLEMMVSTVDIKSLRSEKELRFSQGLPSATDDVFSDALILIDKIEQINNNLIINNELRDNLITLLDMLEVLACVFGRMKVFSHDPCEEDEVSLDFIDVDENNTEESVRRLKLFMSQLLPLAKEAINNKDYGRLFVYCLLHFPNAIVNIEWIVDVSLRKDNLIVSGQKDNY